MGKALCLLRVNILCSQCNNGTGGRGNLQRQGAVQAIQLYSGLTYVLLTYKTQEAFVSNWLGH